MGQELTHKINAGTLPALNKNVLLHATIGFSTRFSSRPSADCFPNPLPEVPTSGAVPFSFSFVTICAPNSFSIRCAAKVTAARTPNGSPRSACPVGKNRWAFVARSADDTDAGERKNHLAATCGVIATANRGHPAGTKNISPIFCVTTHPGVTPTSLRKSSNAVVSNTCAVSLRRSADAVSFGDTRRTASNAAAAARSAAPRASSASNTASACSSARSVSVGYALHIARAARAAAASAAAVSFVSRCSSNAKQGVSKHPPSRSASHRDNTWESSRLKTVHRRSAPRVFVSSSWYERFIVSSLGSESSPSRVCVSSLGEPSRSSPPSPSHPAAAAASVVNTQSSVDTPKLTHTSFLFKQSSRDTEADDSTPDSLVETKPFSSRKSRSDLFASSRFVAYERTFKAPSGCVISKNGVCANEVSSNPVTTGQLVGTFFPSQSASSKPPKRRRSAMPASFRDFSIL
mmetsp:Transcript_12284/g.45740  ORF Transcript_12284/g.45740 Transcript_12284/m.45740 type:complete len:461 (+) Transcript_12284:73-1455(+)